MHKINWINAIAAGVAGLNVGIDMAIGSLVRHWIYVIPFIFLINKEISPKVKVEE